MEEREDPFTLTDREEGFVAGFNAGMKYAIETLNEVAYDISVDDETALAEYGKEEKE